MDDPINVGGPQADTQNGTPPVAQGDHEQPQAATGGSGEQGALGGNPIGQSQSAVLVSVHSGDKRVLAVLIDRTATQDRIIEELGQQLTDFGVPYRSVDPRIFEAVQLKDREGISFREASERIFGNPDMAEKIRYWRNNWSRK